MNTSPEAHALVKLIHYTGELLKQMKKLQQKFAYYYCHYLSVVWYFIHKSLSQWKASKTATNYSLSPVITKSKCFGSLSWHFNGWVVNLFDI